MQASARSSGHNGSGHAGMAVCDGFIALVDEWISRAANGNAVSWFRDTIERIRHESGGDKLAMAIGLAPRRLGKADLPLTPDDKARAMALRPGLDPSEWSIDQAARIAFMVASYAGDDAAFAAAFDGFCSTAGLNELIALCRGLPVYPAAALLEPRAREAVRSGMKPVFEAVAHRNPYPVECFSEDAWNQMVVKAFFIGSHLWPIQELDRRGNPRLARMLVDLAQERWAAGRPVSGEVWRCVAPHADTEGVAALVRAFETGGDKERSRSRLRCSKRSLIVPTPRSNSRTCANRSGTSNRVWWPKRSIGSARMSEWLWPFLSRTLLRTLSAVLTICLLVQFFIAGMAAVTDPGWWRYHSNWVAIFQWLVIPLPVLAWLGGPARARRTLFACIPLLQIALQYVLAHRAIEGRLTIGLGLHALDAGLLLLISAGLAVGLFD